MRLIDADKLISDLNNPDLCNVTPKLLEIVNEQPTITLSAEWLDNVKRGQTITSMTLDDAIKHCHDVADGALCEGTVNHKACGEEHRQLAEWLEEYKILKKKATPEAPDFEGDGIDNNGNIIFDTWICPNCDREYEIDYEEHDYCPECGQALSWEYPDEEDGE